jgi:nitrite reductase/ring-hydroxylating ferredoxin subunit
MIAAHQSVRRVGLASAWPYYSGAARGFRNYWYPVMFSRQLGRKPIGILLCGEKIVLARHAGKAYALHNRCPHRGVPLSEGTQQFPGLLTCAYHGWTYDLQTGQLEAVLTDGPDSPICGKGSVRVASYPVEERAGLVWVYVGELPAPPVEADIPSELLEPGLVVEGVFQLRRGNWRYAAENGIDEGHAKYLHRRALWATFRKQSALTLFHMAPSEDGEWLMRVRDDAVWDVEYPRLGRWPRRHFWQRRRTGTAGVGIRLPGILLNRQRGWTGYELYIPWDEDHYLSGLLATKRASGLAALRFRLWYRLWVRWIFHGQQNGEDQWMIELMNIPPERLYRPDVSVTAWRKLCEETARRTGAEAPSELERDEAASAVAAREIQ